MIASDLRVVGPEGDLEGRQVGDPRQRRQQPLGDRVEQDEDADAGVEDRLHEEGGGDRRVGGVGDLAFDQEDLGHVAGVGGHDRVDPGPGQVGGARAAGRGSAAPGRRRAARCARPRRAPAASPAGRAGRARTGSSGFPRGGGRIPRPRLKKSSKLDPRSAAGIAATLARSCRTPTRTRCPARPPRIPPTRRCARVPASATRPTARAASGAAANATPQLPNLIIVGGLKCGTTSIHHYLGLHPEIQMSKPKELNFFVEEMNWDLGLDWYASRFDDRFKVRGESSPALHEPAPLRGRRRADPRALPRRAPALHGARPDQADPLPLGPRDRRRLRDPRDDPDPLRCPTPSTSTAPSTGCSCSPTSSSSTAPRSRSSPRRSCRPNARRRCARPSPSPASTRTSPPSSSTASGRSRAPSRATNTSSWRS